MTHTDAIVAIQDAGKSLRRILALADEWSVPERDRAPAEAVLAAWERAGEALLRASREARAALKPLEGGDPSRALTPLEAAQAAVRESAVAFGDADRALGELAPRAWAVAGVRWMVEAGLADPSGALLAHQLRELGFSTPREALGDLVGAFYHVFSRAPRGDLPAWERAVLERGVDVFLRRWLPGEIRGEARRRTGPPAPPVEGGDVESLPAPERLDARVELEGLAADLAAAGLSPREQELALEYACGDAATLGAAGREIGMEPSTARTVAGRIREKLRGV